MSAWRPRTRNNYRFQRARKGTRISVSSKTYSPVFCFTFLFSDGRGCLLVFTPKEFFRISLEETKERTDRYMLKQMELKKEWALEVLIRLCNSSLLIIMGMIGALSFFYVKIDI